MTPGKEESDRDAMTASRLDGVEVPVAAGHPLVSPTVDARSRAPALALRFGLPGVAVASALVGWVLFGQRLDAAAVLGVGLIVDGVVIVNISDSITH